MRGVPRDRVAALLGLFVVATLTLRLHAWPAYVAQTFPGVRCSDAQPASAGRGASSPLDLPFDLDDGRLVAAAPVHPDRAMVSADLARAEFRSTAEVAGPHPCVGFGLAMVTTRPSTVGTGSPARLAWVGVVEGVALGCPIITDDTYVVGVPQPVRVVIIDAADPGSVRVYTSRGSYCGFPPTGPSLAAAHQVLSVPFELVNLEVVAYDMPACGARFDDADFSGSPGTGDLVAWVHVSVPFARSHCRVRHVVETWGVSNDVALNAEHAPPGPVAVLSQ
jgi:hypothetical protein